MSRHRTISVILVFGILFLSILACSLGGTSTEKLTTQPKSEGTSPTESPGNIQITMAAPANESELKSNFPLPPKAKVVQSSDHMVTATINMPMQDVIEFYRSEAKKQGLTEYELLTAITDNTFSLAFKSAKNVNELVLQGTDIGNDTVAFSVRYEDVDVK